jgi:alpha-methylacyl-CoA racemase
MSDTGSRSQRTGPLSGLRVLELAAIGPAPLAAKLLADMGADVIRIERDATSEPFATKGGQRNLLTEGRCATQTMDLKSAPGRERLLGFVAHADVLIEGYRPGVMERLQLGPDAMLSINPKLIYARMTGWGQSGPLAHEAGHDINFIALTGALACMGRAGSPPTFPLNLLGDFGGGSMFLVVGILAALNERFRCGKGQVVDAAIVDGVTSLMTMQHSMASAGALEPGRGCNLLDGGAWFYDVYACSDGRYVAVGALEPRFCANLLQVLGIDAKDVGEQYDRAAWPLAREVLARRFLTRTRDEWVTAFAGVDACVTPVLGLSEVHTHPHMASRRVLSSARGIVEPMPAPRFSRHTLDAPMPPPSSALDVLRDWQARVQSNP